MKRCAAATSRPQASGAAAVIKRPRTAGECQAEPRRLPVAAAAPAAVTADVTMTGTDGAQLGSIATTVGMMVATPAPVGRVSLHEAFDALADRFGSRPAAEDDHGVVWSYAQVRDASLCLAGGIADLLRKHGEQGTMQGQDQAARPWRVPLALLAQRTCPWLAASVAAMRLGMPLLGLSGDLRSPEEAQRNREAVQEHRPSLLLVDGALKAEATAIALAAAARASPPPVAELEVLLAAGPLRGVGCEVLGSAESRSAEDVLYFCYTGGTTSASKCVAVTHRMALHELETYPEIAPLQCTDRVLHQSSAYWGASCFGIVDVAWACGGSLVLTEAGAGPMEVAATIQRAGVTVAGVVPSVLEALEHTQAPSLRVIFTWGEALAPATGARWARHAALLDLLIASEYWLILYADHGARLAEGCNDSSRPGFRTVRGAMLTLRRPETEGPRGAGEDEEVKDGEVGELYMAGPMVSSVGYTMAEKNCGAFVDLPLGPGKAAVKHFRTRDLARRRPDGSLEYCGRADGFAKVGGKWLDLAAVERDLLGAGCKEASLVWDEQAKQRHAAVALAPVATARRSLTECSHELRRRLPQDTNLHILPELPHNPATGKVHRGRLVEQVAAAAAGSIPTPAGATGRRLGRSLLWGLLLAAWAGIRGGLLLSLAWPLAPNLLALAPDGLHEGLAGYVANWAGWHRGGVKLLGSLAALRALPHITLLLLDGHATGLEPLGGLVEEGIGLVGMALIASRTAAPWLRWLLATAGANHARHRGGAAAWQWAFWIGWPVLGEQWYSDADCWGDGRKEEVKTTTQALKSLRRLLAAKQAGGEPGPISELRCCSYCWDWHADGGLWHGYWYCKDCTVGWEAYRKQRREDGYAMESPLDTPDESPWYSPRWLPEVDVVDFTPEEVQRASALVPSRGDLGATSKDSAQHVATTPIGRIAEKCTGIDASDPTASLASLESLKIIALVSALRRELGYDLSAADVARCESLAELEALCKQQMDHSSEGGVQEQEVATNGHAREQRWAVHAIPRFWRAPVGWLLRLHELPQERAMRAACAALLWKHPALRAQPYPTPGDDAVAQLCNHAAAMVLVFRSLLHGAANGLFTEAAAGLLAAWPRVSERPPWRGAATDGTPAVATAVGDATIVPQGGALEEAHFQWLRFEQEADLQLAAQMRSRSRGFQMPVSIAVLVLAGARGDATAQKQPAVEAASPRAAGEGGACRLQVASSNGNSKGKDVAYLHVAVNHAVSDAPCVVPLVTDLLALHQAAAEEAALGQAAPLPELAAAALRRAALPPVPNGLAVQEARLAAALLPKRQDLVPTLPHAVDIANQAFPTKRPGYDHYVRLLSGGCRVLEAGSGVLGVPTDHLLVVAIAVAYATLAHLAEVKLMLIVPMRDGWGEERAIANFASTRCLALSLTGRTLFAAALDLSRRLRRREWDLTDPLEDHRDSIFINVRDLPKLGGASAVVEPVNTKRRSTRQVRNAMEMFVDKESSQSWTLSIGLRYDLQGDEFSRALRSCLWRAAVEPLGPSVVPLLPARPPPKPLRSAASAGCSEADETSEGEASAAS